MAKRGKQEINTGSGPTETPILANVNVPTAEGSKPSQVPTSIAEGSTKPVSLPEALSLLQTNCFDLRSMGCRVSILARNDRLYVILAVPDGQLKMADGHILLNEKPVVLG